MLRQINVKHICFSDAHLDDEARTCSYPDSSRGTLRPEFLQGSSSDWPSTRTADFSADAPAPIIKLSRIALARYCIRGYARSLQPMAASQKPEDRILSTFVG